MPFDAQKYLDEVGLAILKELQHDARLSYSELGRRVGLSAPAVAERVRRLEDAGIITGYAARVDPAALGYTVNALIELTTTPGQYAKVLEYAEKTLEVRECYFVTGEHSFVARVVARSIPHLQRIIQQLSLFGPTRTSVVLSTPLIKDTFALEAADLAEG
ncbi:Lrp/AsnC family transcriptional regulator [Marinithermus hydrothermalis]|uniref:Transcriptional regulator, AsnC family n=1 Tax=Marinithermus hydrothermalis (strain DSM 14884 / JCM 11576 / T1) TaxID=869210 RepID=F2NK23_MARHT|nr:Lrp/AsnC family transcriptional regulator [Marinithermus hydrothermalis]AEB11994.1 transcriptional regulator, AsnC family [Marinithermus hydrothermalis DSM 14884]